MDLHVIVALNTIERVYSALPVHWQAWDGQTIYLGYKDVYWRQLSVFTIYVVYMIVFEHHFHLMTMNKGKSQISNRSYVGKVTLLSILICSRCILDSMEGLLRRNQLCLYGEQYKLEKRLHIQWIYLIGRSSLHLSWCWFHTSRKSSQVSSMNSSLSISSYCEWTSILFVLFG